MIAGPFFHASVALAAGTFAQVVAARLAIPAILLLLVVGVLLGPDVLGVLDPSAFGSALPDLVTLGVSVILFEGGLALDFARLRYQQRTLLLLLFVGGATSMVAGTLAAHWIAGLSWSVAMLYGSLMIVTGPTVVTPLLSRLAVSRRLRELLISEGVLIDPLGAIVAIVIAQWVLGQASGVQLAGLVVVRLGIGAIFGVAAGRAIVLAIRGRWLVGDHANAAVLGSVLLVAALASHVSAEAGLMSAVAQGATMGNAGLRELGRLREFKETLSLVMLAFLFVVLAANLRLVEVYALGWPGLATIAVLVWVARPVAVLLSCAGSTLTARERAFVAWICPRGIVAAATAGMFRVLLEEGEVDGGSALEALVFLTVASTVAIQGTTAGLVARLLGIDKPALHGTLIVGANALSGLLQNLLVSLGRQVVAIERDPLRCQMAREEGRAVFEGDALSIEALDEAGARWADTLVAATRNRALNELVAQRAHEHFRVDRVLALTGREDPKKALFPGDFPGVAEADRLLEAGFLELVDYDVARGDAVGRHLSQLPYAPGEFALVLARGEGGFVATADLVLTAGDRLWCVRPRREPGPEVQPEATTSAKTAWWRRFAPRRFGAKPASH